MRVEYGGGHLVVGAELVHPEDVGLCVLESDHADVGQVRGDLQLAHDPCQEIEHDVEIRLGDTAWRIDDKGQVHIVRVATDHWNVRMDIRTQNV